MDDLITCRNSVIETERIVGFMMCLSCNYQVGIIKRIKKRDKINLYVALLSSIPSERRMPNYFQELCEKNGENCTVDNLFVLQLSSWNNRKRKKINLDVGIESSIPSESRMPKYL